MSLVGAAGVRAAVVGIAGTELERDEAALLGRLPPAGVILFRRNCRDRAQLRALVDALRATQPGRRLPILVDQEGGRVARLCPPQWRALPAAGGIGALAERDPAAGREAARLLGRLIAHDLAEIGANVACAPVVDVARPETTDAIGNRAFSADPRRVAELAGACARGLLAGGVAPVIKHLPGHGRARVDSHHGLPAVDATREELVAVDLVPARHLRRLPLAMTAHLLYRTVDPERPGTLSEKVIAGLIRGEAGFDGILLSDDLAMRALDGGPGELAAAAVAAGCDVALACTGRIGESLAVLGAVPDLAAHRLALLDAAVPPPARDGFDADAGEVRLNGLLGAAIA